MKDKMLSHLFNGVKDSFTGGLAVLVSPVVASVAQSPSVWGGVITGIFVLLARVFEVLMKVKYYKHQRQLAEAKMKVYKRALIEAGIDPTPFEVEALALEGEED